MSNQSPVSKPIYSLLPTDVEGFDSLAELALDLRWSWNHATDEVWRQLDAALWEFTQNPWVVLQTVSREKLQRVSADPAFRKKVDALAQAGRQAAKASAWFQQDHPQSPLTRVAYFSMEFMLSEALPIYSGGLGNVAGDQLKAASDLGVQLVNWERAMEQHGSSLRFGEMKIGTDGENHLFEVQVYLSGLDPNGIRVELYADGVKGGEPVRQVMMHEQEPAHANGAIYSVQVPTTRPAKDYTARVIPHCSGVAVPLEAAQILWQR